jgi:hypothetical protein
MVTRAASVPRSDRQLDCDHARRRATAGGDHVQQTPRYTADGENASRRDRASVMRDNISASNDDRGAAHQYRNDKLLARQYDMG